MTRQTNLAFIVAGLAAAFAFLNRKAFASEGPLWTLENVRAVAGTTVRSFNLRVDPDLIARIAWIESSNREREADAVRFNTTALRFENHIGDASAGLMQTLVGTARWLAKDMGYTAFGVPTLDTLLSSPQASIYFGAAYLDYLSRYRGQARAEEWIVRSYNGGPGNVGNATADYWDKYLDAKKVVG